MEFWKVVMCCESLLGENRPFHGHKQYYCLHMCIVKRNSVLAFRVLLASSGNIPLVAQTHFFFLFHHLQSREMASGPPPTQEHTFTISLQGHGRCDSVKQCFHTSNRKWFQIPSS